MKRPSVVVVVVTGTGTGVGKTVLTASLVRHLRGRGIAAVALKPLASGDRSDARALRDAMGPRCPLSLDEVNPWSFRAALSPAIAARLEGGAVTADEVIAAIRRSGAGARVILVEGAGGLLSPLGDDFDARDWVVRLKAIPLIVAANRLGALNEVLLTLEALPASARRRAEIVLMNPPRPGRVARTNLEFLRARLGTGRVHLFPHWRGWREGRLVGTGRRASAALSGLTLDGTLT